MRLRDHAITSAMLLMGAMLLVIAGCERRTPTHAPTSATHLAADGANQPRRVVSLAPALTQMLIELGQKENIVGVAEHDTLAPAGAPVVGTFLDVQAEPLLATRPTLVVTMVGKAGVPARLRELSNIGRFELVTFAFPERVSEVAHVLSHDLNQAGGSRSLAAAVGAPERGQQLRFAMLDQLQQLRELTRDLPRKRVLLVIGTNPVMASGAGTVLDELLDVAGGTNAAANSPVRAPTFDRENLLALQPQVIILTQPGAMPLVSPDTDARLAEFRNLDIPAVRENRITLINDPLVHVAGTNLPRIAAALARAIHPGISERIDAILNAQSNAANQPTRE